MPLTIPPAVNYPSPLTAVPSRIGMEPSEGRKSIPCEIDWSSMGGAEKCVSLNFQNNATLEISQVCALKIDNSACGADIEFIFPDTGETVSIPAYSPDDILPVFTNQKMFFISSPNSQTGDVTRFQILNFVPPPIAVPTSVAQSAVVDTAIPLAIGTTALLGATISGTVQAISIAASIYTATNFNEQFNIKDGSGKNIAGAGVAGNGTAANYIFDGLLFTLSGLDVRFTQGLNFVQAGSAPGDAFSFAYVNVYYRTP